MTEWPDGAPVNPWADPWAELAVVCAPGERTRTIRARTVAGLVPSRVAVADVWESPLIGPHAYVLINRDLMAEELGNPVSGPAPPETGPGHEGGGI